VNILECIRKLAAEPVVVPAISKMLVFMLWLKMVDLGRGSAGKDKKPQVRADSPICIAKMRKDPCPIVR
jgi:hypothetical protein